MIKVSEVQKKLEALGCHKKQAKNLLVACGILEDDNGKNVIFEEALSKMGRFKNHCRITEADHLYDWAIIFDFPNCNENWTFAVFDTVKYLYDKYNGYPYHNNQTIKVNFKEK